MIQVNNETTVLGAVQKLLSGLVNAGSLELMSVNGLLGGVLDDSFRFGVFDLRSDVLHEDQRIRFRFDVDDVACKVFVGSDKAVDLVGAITSPIDPDSNLTLGQMHCDGGGSDLWFDFRPDKLEEVGAVFSGMASATDHGIAFAVWEQTSVISACNYSWFVVQRPVNQDGSPYIEDRAPVVCLYGSTPDTSNWDNIMFNVVREVDVHIPTPYKKAGQHHVDRVAVINHREQVAIAPSKKACLFFPYGFNTQRYYYSLELDMVAYTSADVISMSSEVTDDRFGSLKSYIALNSNLIHNKGMRIVLYNGDL